jgi:DNA-binding beta-propeller fold protein YncE
MRPTGRSTHSASEEVHPVSIRPSTYLLTLAFCLVSLVSSGQPAHDYWVYVVCESADLVERVQFGREGARVDREVEVGLMPVDIDGPHGVDVSADGLFYYVSLAHGRPFGSLWKYRTADDSVAGRVGLGMFPASLQVSQDDNFVFTVNFNLHGDMEPSSVSVVATDEMVEVARVPTCTMPHGSRINPQGTKHYSACMMDDTLVEIDAATFEVSRTFLIPPASEPALEHHPAGHQEAMPVCSPTWAEPSSDGAFVFVACNQSNEILEIDTRSWSVNRRLRAGEGVYNLARTGDGRLLATNKRGQSVSVFDLRTGRELARIPTRRNIVHGVVVAPDDLYAFVSVEGVGTEPGTVEVIDLERLETVATVDVGAQAAGIAFWKMSEP